MSSTNSTSSPATSCIRVVIRGRVILFRFKCTAPHNPRVPTVKFLAGVTLMAMWSLTVLQTCSQSPHPTHRSLVIMRRSASKSIARASVGHLDTQAWQPWPAVQSRCDTTATPIRTEATSATDRRASVPQAAMHGKSSQSSQAVSLGNTTGVALAGSVTMAAGGQALTQSPQRVHRSRNCASATAPGGRSQSWRRGAASGSRPASLCKENSLAALATEITESLRKSRRP